MLYEDFLFPSISLICSVFGLTLLACYYKIGHIWKNVSDESLLLVTIRETEEKGGTAETGSTGETEETKL